MVQQDSGFDPNVQQPQDAMPAVVEDPFAGRQPVRGLEALGRAIVDEQGSPSGSPANYEELRGCPHPDGWKAFNAQPAIAAAEDIITSIRSELVDRVLPRADVEAQVETQTETQAETRQLPPPPPPPAE